MSVCLDKNSAEIVAAARAKIRRQKRRFTSNNLTKPFFQNGFINELSKNENGIADDASSEELNEDCFLIEVKSNGERVVYSHTGKHKRTLEKEGLRYSELCK